MPRPRLLLCPQFTEVEWAIVPQLSEWADVATFDAPGIGDEPIPGGDLTRLDRGLVVQRALQEVERLEWDSYFVVGDAWGTATAVRVAVARPEPVLGLALGHASLNYETKGERPAVNGELAAAMTRTPAHGLRLISCATGSPNSRKADSTRTRPAGWLPGFRKWMSRAQVWEMHVGKPEPIGELLGALDKPLLLAKHDGCLAFTPEGYESAVAAFPSCAGGQRQEDLAGQRRVCAPHCGTSARACSTSVNGLHEPDLKPMNRARTDRQLGVGRDAEHGLLL